MSSKFKKYLENLQMTVTSRFRKGIRPFLLTVGVLIIALLSWFRVFEPYELQLYDWRCHIRGPRPISNDIALVVIGNDTLKQFGDWPFDRERHGDLINVLTQHGAKAIVFDVIFVESHPKDGQVTSAAAAGKNVYYSFAFFNARNIRGRYVCRKYDSPLNPAYMKVAKGIGYVNTIVDCDGKRRRTMPMIYYTRKRGEPYLQLAFKVAADVLNIKSEQIKFRRGKSLEFSKDLKIPLNDDSSFNVNYARRWDEQGFPQYSFADLVNASYMEQAINNPAFKEMNWHPEDQWKPEDLREAMRKLEAMRNKICIVGVTATGAHDNNPTPLEGIYPMVGQYANIVNSILMKDFISRLDRFSNMFLAILLAMITIFLSMRFKPFRALLSVLEMALVYTGFAFVVFNVWGLWVDLFYPLLLISLLYAAGTLGRVINEMRKRQLMENELSIASQIQKSFLPAKPPVQKGMKIAVYMKPAKAIGGDLYAFIPLDGEKLGVMVGDVSGKGTPAALFMAKVVSEFKFHARGNLDPADVLRKINDMIAVESTSGLFVTMCYLVFDPVAMKIKMTNGGHLPVVCVGPDGKGELLSAESGMPIGVMDGVSFEDFERDVKIGECFALYSDGVSEARNKKAEEFSVEALQQVMADHHKEDAEKILNKSVERLNLFMGKADQHDDITLIILKIEPEPAPAA